VTIPTQLLVRALSREKKGAAENVEKTKTNKREAKKERRKILLMNMLRNLVHLESFRILEDLKCHNFRC